VPATATPTPRPAASLADAVQAAVGRHPGTIGVVVTSLSSPQAFSLNADRRFRSASLYKLFVLYTAEVAIEDGTLDPDETLTVTRAVAASDPYTDLLVGSRISVDCALRTMVEMSGNTAADLLVDRLGLQTVTTRMQSLGLDHSALTDDTAFTSPGDVARVLEAIGRHAAVSASASDRMRELLSRQQHNDRLPAPLPLAVRLAHKTGELPKLRHDAGIVLAPGASYVVVAMVEDAPDEAEARAAIVDVSQAVYAALEPTGLSPYMGLAPRLAQAVFRVPDAQGRLALLGDPRTETAPLPPTLDTSADTDEPLRLRSEVVPDLVALQQAAANAGVPFWVRSGFRQPTDAEAARTLPTEWILPCPVEQPERVPDRPVSRSEAAAAQPRQVWLGTVLAVSDTDGAPSQVDDRSSPAWRWLMLHAAEYGFVPALPETAGSRDAGHEAWTLRWVGREMAARLRPFDSADYAQRATTTLQAAEVALAAQDARSAEPPLWGLGDACWTVATTSGRGCPSRWYFLGLPLS
jgi:beta-lactamase class A